MTDQPSPIEQHEAADRAGKAALRAAHDLGAALTDDGIAEPAVLRTGGRHRSIDRLTALVDAALDEAALDEAALDEARSDGASRRRPTE